MRSGTGVFHDPEPPSRRGRNHQGKARTAIEPLPRGAIFHKRVTSSKARNWPIQIGSLLVCGGNIGRRLHRKDLIPIAAEPCESAFRKYDNPMKSSRRAKPPQHATKTSGLRLTCRSRRVDFLSRSVRIPVVRFAIPLRSAESWGSSQRTAV